MDSEQYRHVIFVLLEKIKTEQQLKRIYLYIQYLYLHET